MNYTNIYLKHEKALLRLEKKLHNLNNHLLKHEYDYQARIASVVLLSNIVNKRQYLAKIDYLAKVQIYSKED